MGENALDGEQRGIKRPARYLSHAIVEVRKFKHLPFFARSAILLDISLGGFKLEFTSEASTSPGAQYWLNIPLAPLGIFAPSRLLCHAECRWFDEKRYRIGGVFTDLSHTDRQIIQHVIETLGARGNVL